MGYTIGIGQAVCTVDMDELDAWWSVEGVDGKPLGAPIDTRGHEPPTHENSTFPSYIVWSAFLKSAGIYEIFLGSEEWNDHPVLLGSHPGIVRLTAEHLAAFEAARAAYRGRSIEPSEQMGPIEWVERVNEEAADWHRKRLDWLCWWTRWAIENCTHPAMANS